LDDERRRTPRYPFSAPAEILQKGATTGNPARVTELSLYGCCIEMPNPLPKGSEIMVKIFTEGRYFEARASVLYLQSEQAMGIGFHNVNPHYLTALRLWLIEAAQARFGKKE